MSTLDPWVPERGLFVPDTDRLKHLMLREGVDPNLAQAFSDAMGSKLIDDQFHKREYIEELRDWANTHTHAVEAGETVGDVWTQMTSAPLTLQVPGAAFIVGKEFIYWLGGTTAEWVKYEIATDTWVGNGSDVDLDEGRNAALDPVNDIIYLNRANQGHFIKFDPATNTATLTGSGASVLPGSHGYGYYNETILRWGQNALEEFDIASGVFSTLQTGLSFVRHTKANGVFGDYLYVFDSSSESGLTGSAVPEPPKRIDLSALTEETLSEPSSGRRKQATGAFGPDNAFYMVGGYDTSNSFISETWRYDPSSDSWESRTAPPWSIAIGNIAESVFVGNFMYVLVGNNLWRYG